MTQLTRFYILFVVLFCNGLINAFDAQGVENKKTRILLLNSYHNGYQWTDDITSAVFDYYKNDNQINLYVENLDLKRFQDFNLSEELFALYQLKYNNIKLDGIICSDNNAFDFLLKYKEKLWKGTPVVYCGVNNVEAYRSKVDTTVYCGIDEKLDIKSTIEVIKAIQPDVNEIILLGDETQVFQIFQAQFEEAVREVQPIIPHQIFKINSLQQLDSLLGSMDAKGKALYNFVGFFYNIGLLKEYEVSADSIFRKYPIPVYGNYDFLMPKIIVGGKVISGSNQGFLAAKLLLDRIKSPNVNYPFVAPCPTYYMFDYQQLLRFNFNVGLLPPNSLIVNKEISIFDKYKKQTSIALGLFVLLISIILLLISSIMNRLRAEQALLKSENRLELALEGANQGLWDVNLLDGSVFINKQFAELLDYKSAKEVGLTALNWMKFVHQDDVEHLTEAYMLHLQGKINFMHCEVRVLTQRNENRWIAIHGKITEVIDGVPQRITGSILNITLQKDYENALLFAKEKAEESDMLKTSFLANMSHEIRTPMNAIVGFSDLILSDSIEVSDRQNYLSIIKSSGESLLNLINDIIDISKIESGQLKMIFEDFDLNNKIDKLERLSKTLILNSNKTLAFKIQKGLPNEPFVIYTDPYRLEQVLLNLITNSIKFTSNGSIELGYSVVDSTHVKFYVKDTGIGIADEHKQIIFDRFRQGDESTAKRFGGTGLGLAISNSLVGMLGGSISVESEIDKGSTFTFQIKVEKLTRQFVSLS